MNNTMRDKAELINLIISHKKYKSYLELGVGHRIETISQINCKEIISVDIEKITENIPSFVGTTDDFFKSTEQKFDIIYIDADHHFKSVDKDFKNSIEHLTRDGIICMHDIGPVSEHDTRPRASGTAFMSFMHIRENPEFDAFSYEFENGDILGLVKLSTNTEVWISPEPRGSFATYIIHRDTILRKKNIEQIVENI